MSQLAINVMSPSIQEDLDIDSTNIQLISTSFSLAYGGTLLLAGRISDIYGHKLCLLIGLTIFSGFSLASALANSALQLAVFRAIQGLGAAAISPALLGILARTFAKGSKMRTEGFAAFSTGSPLGASIGLLVGDGITSATRPGWRSFFYFCLALSGLAVILSHFILPSDPPQDPRKSVKDVDWLGAAMLMSGLVVLVVSLLFFPRYGWRSPYMVIPLCSGVLILLTFLVWEIYVDWRGSSEPLLIVGLALNLITGHLADLLPAQLIVFVGCAASLSSCAFSAYMDPDGSYWRSNFAAIILSVIGSDFVFSIVAMFGSRISRSDEQGIAGAVLLSFTRIFSVIGLGIATIAQSKAPPAAYWQGLKAAFTVCLCSAILATIISAAALWGMGYVGAHRKEANVEPILDLNRKFEKEDTASV
ncbi:major facilitator superfamily domain-containing protein [Melampsora americana]|nr:major facilitator superfamily domain-containing protein [Melampsora americana]